MVDDLIFLHAMYLPLTLDMQMSACACPALRVIGQENNNCGHNMRQYTSSIIDVLI